MSDTSPPTRGRRWRGTGATLSIAVALAATISAIATASTASPTVKSAHNAALNKSVLVDSRGRTLYELAPETVHHLLCKSSACFGFWPPLKVSSAKVRLIKGAGVKGKLGTLHRKGFFQVTLDGRPLYHFSQDTAKGQANGQGIMGFGGRWHVVNEGATSGAGTTSTTTTTTGGPTMTTTTTSSTYSLPY
jgi:predicted lipoprotein with Yx(FWY)xxD motif